MPWEFLHDRKDYESVGTPYDGARSTAENEPLKKGGDRRAAVGCFVGDTTVAKIDFIDLSAVGS